MIRLALVVAVFFAAIPAIAQVPSLEGTYRLVSRTLPDGRVQRPPEVVGLMTLTKTHRNMNVMVKDGGKHFSLSQVSTYKLSASEFSETLLFQMVNDEITGKGLRYDTAGRTQSAPAKIEGRRVEFKFPFEAPTVSFDGDKATARAPSGLVAVWEKVD